MLAAIAALLVAVAAPQSAGAAAERQKLTRYSIAGGCFGLRSEERGRFVAEKGSGPGAGYAASARRVGAAEPFRMQATSLGRYLFYGSDRDFMALGPVGPLGTVAPAAEPSNDAVWIVRRAGRGFVIYNGFRDRYLNTVADGTIVAGERPERFGFAAASGCPRYPELEVNARGAPSTGATSYGEVSGLIDAHMHGMAFEFLGGRAHCGRPWHRFGAPYALQDCPDHEPNGAGAVLENTVSYGNPAGTHDTDGWPSFDGWPHHASLTHEQSYYKWLERAWRGGMRVYVNLMVENEVLCELYPLKKNSCDEMDSVRLQVKRLHQMEAYIDAQEGGPGKGWFRIVRNPFQARRVINRGKLAVVMGMETSKPFGCGRMNDTATCDEAQIEQQIDEFYELGIRQLELINKFDNGFAGVAGDSGSTGTITNFGNFYDTGQFWDYDSCEDPHYHDRSPDAVYYHNDDELIANGLEALLPPDGAAPVYPEPPNCNQLGLTDEGEHALETLIDKRLIFDPDHMSVKARQQALDVVEARDYSGVVSSHSWSTHDAIPRIYDLGGVVTPYAGNSESFVAEWREIRHHRNGRYYYGVGYGADMNGFGGQGAPRGAGVPNPVSYPFRSFDGEVTLGQQQSGTRIYDINVDGVAHYGLYPDWVEDLRQLAGGRIIRDMGRGAEAYLQMWERAVGVPPVACRARPGRLHAGGLGEGLRLGASANSTLRSAGQPSRRARAWSWCGREAGKQRPGALAAVFTPESRIGLVRSELASSVAAGVSPGDREAAIPDSARRTGGLRVLAAGGASDYVYGVRNGRVAFTAVAAREISSRPASLRRYLARAG